LVLITAGRNEKRGQRGQKSRDLQEEKNQRKCTNVKISREIFQKTNVLKFKSESKVTATSNRKAGILPPPKGLPGKQQEDKEVETSE
jgi:hypothetical protein